MADRTLFRDALAQALALKGHEVHDPDALAEEIVDLIGVYVPAMDLDKAIELLREMGGAGVECATALLGMGGDEVGNTNYYNRWRRADTAMRSFFMSR